jgi:hypothetical protein
MSALVRSWYPSPNYSSGSTKRLIVIHTTEGFTGSNGMYDCAIYFQGPVGASSHIIADNFHPGHVCEGVKRDKGSWTQCQFNSVSVSVEQCAYASWSRDTWLNTKEVLLRNTAAWIAEESRALGIPITRLSASQAQSGGKGICGHSDLGPSGCGHSDPGQGYPWDVVLQWARGEQPQPQPPEVEDYEDMTLIEPGVNKPVGISFGFKNEMKSICLLADVGVTDAPQTMIRVAAHVYGTTNWTVRDMILSESNPRGEWVFPDNIDGVSIMRGDDVNVGIVATFVRR